MPEAPVFPNVDLPDPLAAFLPPVREWFAAALGQPTPPQAQGWPAIQRGEHTLILAPTGSGKTLTAFLWGLDQLWRDLPLPAPEEPGRKRKRQPQPEAGIRLIYISPLKALNNDIERNLRVPLAGIRQTAERLGHALPDIEVAVRSGDTPARERTAMLRTPPHILITTPESLYILLTSPKGRELFRSVRTVIVDEIHTLAGSKRGVHLSLSLERLQQLAAHPIQRIGLSATIQPLEEVARYLGGNDWQGEGAARVLQPRPVTIVNAGYRKPLDLEVETVVEDFRNLGGASIWPQVVGRVSELIDEHRSTLIFVNNRRLAERAADWLNAQRAQPDGSAMIDGGVVTGVGMLGLGAVSSGNAIRAHHGSMSKETRLALERDLKLGRLPAIIGTSSLELGIDIGAIDLVVQLQAPKSVAQGLQRIGRAGHLVGQTSKGRIFPTHREDVMEAAAVAGGMLHGEVEPTHTPRNPLDILAQQIVAMVAVEDWAADALYELIRGAYAYEGLTRRAYHAVLEMLAGRYPSLKHRELRPRISWDKVNNVLAALPGARLLAMTNGGTIPDRGAFSAYLADGRTKLGELDEEFVYETRVGDTFTLGSHVWRVVELTDDKVMVADAAGATPRMPFWRGDFPWRPYELGCRVGEFRRTVAARLSETRVILGLELYREVLGRRDDAPVQELLAWLRREYALDANSAWQVLDYVAGQLDHSGLISSDRTVLVELFDDPLGDPRMVVQSPFGGRVNGLWGIALAATLRERTGVQVEVQSNDDGILFRFPDADAAFPLDVVTQMGAAEARERVLLELPNSAVFGAQFRQNAARALMLPGRGHGKRTPFWLQRLRAKDLLALVRGFEDFPIVAETYRDCLQEVMDLPNLELVLAGIARGEIEVVAVESFTPSPVAQSLLYDFISVYMYEWDAPKAERQLQTLAMHRDLLQDLLDDVNLADLLRPEAVEEVRRRLQHTAPATLARTPEELANLFLTLGDLSASEISLRTTVEPSGWIGSLAGAGRIFEVAVPTAQGVASRWAPAEYVAEYRAAFGPEAGATPETEITPDEARAAILARYLDQAGPVTRQAITARYAFPEAWLDEALARLVASRQLAQGRFSPPGTESAAAGETTEFIERGALEQIHRRTLTILRGEVRPVPFAVYADFLARWQHLHPGERLVGEGSLQKALQQLRAAPVVGRVWERDVLPLRLARYLPAELAENCRSGEVVWVGAGGVDPRRMRVRLLFRGEGHAFLDPAPADVAFLGEDAQAVYGFLKQEGAVFLGELRAGLDLGASALEAALLELAMAGLATNDSLDVLRRLFAEGSVRPSAERKPISALEAELAERLGQRASASSGTPRSLMMRPSRSEMRAARQRVRARLEQDDEMALPVAQEGRWGLVHRFGVLGKTLPREEQAARQARQLLARYGVVTHASLDNEEGAWEWSAIYQELQRLEMRGEVRRGYFVEGLPGVQFAAPEAVERLRASGGGAGDEDEALVVMNACDPANLYGSAETAAQPALPDVTFTFARLPSTWLVLQRGMPVVLLEGTGAQVTTAEGMDEGVVARALQRAFKHIGRFERTIKVEQWNGEPVLQSAGQPILEACGFYRDFPGMRLG